MRVVTEYNDKRVDIKLPISRHDYKPDTPKTLAALLNEVLAVHGLQNELKVTVRDEILQNPKKATKNP